MMIAAAAASFSSCQKSELAGENIDNQAGFVVNIEAEPCETKAEFGAPDGTSYPVLWKANKNAIFSLDGAAAVESATTPSVDERTATFAPSFATEPAASGTVYGAYPKGEYVRDGVSVGGFTSVTADTKAFFVVLPANQTPLANSVDPTTLDVFGAVDYVDEIPSPLSMSFDHVMAYGKMVLNGYAGNGIKSVSITFPTSVAGPSCKYYIADDAQFSAGNVYNANVSTIEIDAANVESNTIWFTVAPVGTLSTGKITIIVTDNDDAEFQKVIDLTAKSIAFNAGEISKFTVGGFTAAPKRATFDLTTTAQITNATSEQLAWTSSAADMVAAKGSATTATNNYYPGTVGQSYTSTRFYKNSTLTISPRDGVTITKVVFTATTTSYATNLSSTVSTWTNATAAVNETTVTVTPTDGTSDISVTLGNTSGHTSVQVFYTGTPAAPYATIRIDDTLELESDECSGTLEPVYNYTEDVDVDVFANPDKTGECNWLIAVMNANGTDIDYSAEENTSDEGRTAYIVIYAMNEEAHITEKVITVTQAAPGGGKTNSIEINTTNSGVTDSYADKTFDVDDVTFGFTQWMKNTNIQAKKSTTNSCYNVDAIPGKIKKITVVQTGTARAIKIYGGTSSKPTTEITAPSTAATMEFVFTGKNYTYFSMTTPNNAVYINTITIEYE